MNARRCSETTLSLPQNLLKAHRGSVSVYSILQRRVKAGTGSSSAVSISQRLLEVLEGCDSLSVSEPSRLVTSATVSKPHTRIM